MQNFTRITLITLVLLILVTSFKLSGGPNHINLPLWLLNLHQNLLSIFFHPQNANFLFSILTGEKNGLSGRLIHDLDVLNLRFLLSPSGLHLSSYLYFLKKRNKKLLPIYFGCWFLPSFYSLKRIALLKSLILFNKKIKTINLYYLTFIISFLCGHFFKSPLGFIYSFLIIGTFFSIKDLSLTKAFLALSASHLLIAVFTGNSFSFLGLFLSLLIVQLFTILLPFLALYIITFLVWPSRWIEPIIRFFILTIHYASLSSKGTFFTSSIMLLICIWVILLKKNKWWILVCLAIHSECLQSPILYSQESSPQVRLASEHMLIYRK